MFLFSTTKKGRWNTGWRRYRTRTSTFSNHCVSFQHNKKRTLEHRLKMLQNKNKHICKTTVFLFSTTKKGRWNTGWRRYRTRTSTYLVTTVFFFSAQPRRDAGTQAEDVTEQEQVHLLTTVFLFSTKKRTLDHRLKTLQNKNKHICKPLCFFSVQQRRDAGTQAEDVTEQEQAHL